MRKTRQPDCNRCAAFFVTHDPRHPYGCRTFAMRTKGLPSVAVRRASGEECHAFTPKNKPEPPKRGGLYG